MSRLTPDEFVTPLGWAIRDLGLSVQRAADLCEIHTKTMAGYCKKNRTGARTPSRSMLLHICKTLNLNPDDFTHGGDQRNGYYVRPAELLGME